MKKTKKENGIEKMVRRMEYLIDQLPPGGREVEVRREIEEIIKTKSEIKPRHFQKARNAITKLRKIIKEENLSRKDIKLVERIIHDLRNAINRVD